MSVKHGKEFTCRQASSCQFLVDNEKCGETCTLEIFNEFKQLYETKMRQIDDCGDGDSLSSLQAKLDLQYEWVKDLTAQNEMLVRTVEELECEATGRVLMLEEKLKNSANVGAQVMKKYRELNIINLDGTFQKVEHLQSDLFNLIRCIKRGHDDGDWNVDDLHFYAVDPKDFLGENGYNEGSTQDMNKGTALLKQKDEEIDQLKQSMLDMRIALTNEVAEKHDTILNLRRDVQQLENQCWQANQHNQFKEDIIKELRKEIKLLKTQPSYLTLPSSVTSTTPALIHAVLSVSENQNKLSSDLCPLSQNNNNNQLNDYRETSLTNDIEAETDRSAFNQYLFNQKLLTKGRKNYDDKKQLQPNFNARITSSTEEKKQLNRRSLTMHKVLHEQYKIKRRGSMTGSVQSFYDLPPKKDFMVPEHQPVKTIVTNIERGFPEE